MKVPRWGIHNGIKYSPKRSLLKICPQCDKLFLQYNKGYRIYCSDVCRANAHRKQKRIIDEKIRRKRNKYEHAERERIAYAQGLRSKKTWTPGTNKAIKQILKPPKKEDGEIDWEAYHKSLTSNLKSIGLG